MAVWCAAVEVFPGNAFVGRSHGNLSSLCAVSNTQITFVYWRCEDDVSCTLTGHIILTWCSIEDTVSDRT